MYDTLWVRITRATLIGIGLALAIIFFLFPMYWITLASFKTKPEILSSIPLHLFQFTPNLDNYRSILGLTTGETEAGTPGEYLGRLLNSIIIAGGSTVLAVFFGTLTAYAMARFRIPGKSDIMFYILSSRMLPPVVIIIPVFLMFTQLGLKGTHLGLTLLYTTVNLPFVVWMMKGFFDEIPHEYEDAAMLDGYPRIQAFFRVTLPNAWPGIAATAVFCIIVAWNEYAFAFILNSEPYAQTVPSFIASKSQTSAGINWGIIAAMSTLFVLPVLVFTFLVRNHLLRGVTFGAVRR
ncbi:MAG: carbohydrate ABC transporter permease [Chloroflexi bacterium]|nr:MAG: carbohydrate ABC transporter permease [Chloroflexota bacterium]TME99157.1 MAG: carbohydrate ABC transporter permease [Chloroflexota bacterium]